MPHFVLTRDDTPVGVYDIPEDVITVGRAADNTICIAHESVSRYHAVIEKTPDGFRISDKGSLNGVVVGGEKVASAILVDEAKIILGKYHIVLTGLKVKKPSIAPTQKTLSVAPGVAAPAERPDLNVAKLRPTISVDIRREPAKTRPASLEDAVTDCAIKHPLSDEKTLARILRKESDPPVKISTRRIRSILSKNDLQNRKSRVFAGL